VRFVLGRAERELALRDQLRLSDESEGQVISPWRALGRAGEHFVPVQNLGEGRAWLALVDGSTVATHAQMSFGKLAHWVQRFVEPVESPADHDNSDEMIRKQFQLRPQVDPTVGWWAREVQVYLFGADAVTRADDIGTTEFDAIRERLVINRETLDTLEEDYVRRYSRA
jgi:hypothetical protein